MYLGSDYGSELISSSDVSGGEVVLELYQEDKYMDLPYPYTEDINSDP